MIFSSLQSIIFYNEMNIGTVAGSLSLSRGLSWQSPRFFRRPRTNRPLAFVWYVRRDHWVISTGCDAVVCKRVLELDVPLLCSSLGSKLSRPKVGQEVLVIRHCRRWGSNPGAMSLVLSRPGACWRESTSGGLSKATSSICDQAPDHCLWCEQYSINLRELGCWLLYRDGAARHHA